MHIFFPHVTEKYTISFKIPKTYAKHQQNINQQITLTPPRNTICPGKPQCPYDRLPLMFLSADGKKETHKQLMHKMLLKSR